MRKLAQKPIKNDSKPDIPKAGLTEPLDKRAEKRQYQTGEDSLKHWHNLEPELRKIIKENNGDLPGSEKLKEDGHGNVVGAICDHHGGFRAFRKKLKELGILDKNPKQRHGEDSLKHWHNLEPKLRKIIEENNGDLPGWNKLKEDHCDVTNAIYKYHGKFPAVRKKLKELGILDKGPKRRTGEDSLKHWHNLEPELRKIIKENQGNLPDSEKLQEDHSDVVSAIYKYHGKFPAVREKLRELGILKDRISEAEIREHLAKAIDAYMGE